MPKPPAGKRSVGGLIFLLLFGGFFLSFGVAGVWAGIRALGSEQPGDQEVWLPLLVGGVFGAVGLAVLVFGIRAWLRGPEPEQEPPDEPWLGRAEWRRGQLVHRARGGMVALWAITLFVGALSTPLLFALRDEWDKGNKLILLGLVFPLFALVTAVMALRETLRWRRYGDSLLELRTRAGVIGKGVLARLRAPLPQVPEDKLSVQLACVRRTVSGSGRNRSTRERMLWEEHTRPVSSHRALNGQELEIAVRIPDHPALMESRDLPEDDKVLWVLTVRADVRGVDYEASFELPVVRARPELEPFPTVDMPPPRPRLAAPRGVQLTPTGDGGLELWLGPCRNLGLAVGSTLFATIWLGAIWLMLHLGAPRLFPIVFGLFAILIVWGALEQWVGTRRCLISGGRLSVTGGWLSVGRTRSVACSQVEGLETKLSSQQQGTGTRGWYGIEARLRNGRKLTLASQLRHKQDAEWLLARLEQALASCG